MFYTFLFPGSIAMTCGHPFETMKVRQQIYRKPVLDTMKATYRYEGIRGFFRGIAPPVAMAGIYNAIFFGVFGNTLRLLQGTGNYKQLTIEEDPNWAINFFCAGSMGGLAQTLFGNPLEYTKTVMQSAASKQGNTVWRDSRKLAYTGVFGTMADIYKKSGFLGFYHGLIPTLWRYILILILNYMFEQF